MEEKNRSREEVENYPRIDSIEYREERPIITPLIHAIKSNMDAKRRYKICKHLLEHGARVDQRDTHDLTALQHLLTTVDGNDNYDRKLLNLLIEKNADIECRDMAWHTPLALAVYAGNFEAAVILLESGANLKAVNIFDDTILSEACGIKGSEEMVRLLIAYGTNVNDLSAIERTLQEKRPDLLTLLFENGADFQKMMSDNLDLTDNFLGSIFHEFVSLFESGKDYAMIQCFLENGLMDTFKDRSIEMLLRIGHLTMEDFSIFKAILFSSLLLKQIALSMENPGKQLSKKILDSIKGFPERWSIYNRFLNQIKLMKTKRVSANKPITYFDLLIERKKPTVNYYDSEVVSAMSKAEYKNFFPDYSGMLEKRFQRGLLRKNISDEFCRMLYEIFKSKIPFELVLVISQYISMHDLFVYHNRMILESRITNIMRS